MFYIVRTGIQVEDGHDASQQMSLEDMDHKLIANIENFDSFVHLKASDQFPRIGDCAGVPQKIIKMTFKHSERKWKSLSIVPMGKVLAPGVSQLQESLSL